MFKVANSIAYNNLMISATKNSLCEAEKIFPQSLWFDVKTTESMGHWVEKEGETVIKILSKIINNSHEMPSLYIISPFKKVAGNMKSLIAKELKGTKFNSGSITKDQIKNWLYNKSIGTIHTFQGKEAQIVILLLGGNADLSRPGSRNWVAEEPNILNVGLTRAKNLVFVVGNYDDWKRRNYFGELASEIKRVDIEDVFDEETIKELPKRAIM